MSDDEGQQQKKVFAPLVEYAKSARSGCKKCKEKIPKDELRVGIVTSRDDVEMTAWYHPACCPRKRGGMEASSFRGYDDLKPEGQAIIDGLCDGSLPSAKKARVDTADSKDRNADEPGFEAAHQKYAALTIPELKKWLETNDQPRTGTKPGLLTACVDGELHGALPRCPLCEHGRLKLAEKGLACMGYHSEESKVWRSCAYTCSAGSVERLAWRTLEQGKRPESADPVAASTSAAAEQLDPALFVGLDMRAAADKLVEIVREAGATIATDRTTARIAAGTSLNTCKKEDGTLDPAAAFKDLLIKFPPKRTAKLQVANPANETICALLREYADLLEKLGENVHGVKGTRTAVANIMKLEYAVTSGKPLAAAKTKVEGVGAGTASKIDEILATGTFEKLEEMRARASAL